MHDEERNEQAETFNQDQQEMFQNPDISLGETRPRTPGTETLPPAATDSEDDATNEQSSIVNEHED